MSTSVALLSSLLALSASAPGLVRSNAPIPVENDATERYVGHVTISGQYVEDQGGELCFRPDPASLKRLKVVTAHATLCFSNEEHAAKLLDAASAIKEIDTQRVCGLSGWATIVVSGLWVGNGPSTRWYTTRLVRVQKRAPARLIACGA